MRLIKGLIMVIGVIGIIIIFALIIGYYLYSLSPSIQERLIPVAVSADAAQSFDQKLDTLDKLQVGSNASRGRTVTIETRID
jgi:hypothetical protein